jgi:signal transduction histidine kinase
MAGIGLFGGGAGLILGYGVARRVGRTIRRLQVQLRDATGKLDPQQGAEIVLTEEVAFGSLHQQLDQLTEQIEQIVERLRQREHEVLRAEQLAAVGQLAAGVAHELRNPLTSIKMLVQTGLENGGGLSSEDLVVMEDAVRRMERTLQAFLDFARPPKLERHVTDVGQLLPAVLQLVRGRADKQHVELCWEVPSQPIPAVVDAAQVQQVLINLLLNALDAMPQGGRITLRLQADHRYVCVEVDDSGPGIPPEHMPRLFEPFFSTKATGLGLGLVICRRIVEDHGGTLEITNLPQKGVRCRVILPRYDAENSRHVFAAAIAAPVVAG